MSRWLIALFLIVGLVALGYVGYLFQPKLKLGDRFRLAAVERGDLETSVNSSGTIDPVRKVDIGCFVSGPIAELKVDFNSRVKGGEVIAIIDERLTRAALDRDLAQVTNAKAQVTRAEADLKRSEALEVQTRRNQQRGLELAKLKESYIAKQELDRLEMEYKSNKAQVGLARAAVDQAEAAVKQAQAALKQSETNLEYTKVTAPVDGVIIDRKVNPGQTMQAGFQVPVMFIMAPEMDKRMLVLANVDEADIGQIQKAKGANRPVTFTVDAHPDDIFTGTIREIRLNHKTTQNVVTYEVVVDAPQQLTPAGDFKLLPGMTANISFQIERREGVLKLPNGALRYYPRPDQVHPDDKKVLEGVLDEKSDRDAETNQVNNSGQAVNAVKPSANERIEAARKGSSRIVWKADPVTMLLRAVRVTTGLSDSRFTEIIEGDLKDGDELVVGNRTPTFGAGS